MPNANVERFVPIYGALAVFSNHWALSCVSKELSGPAGHTAWRRLYTTKKGQCSRAAPRVGGHLCASAHCGAVGHAVPLGRAQALPDVLARQGPSTCCALHGRKRCAGSGASQRWGPQGWGPGENGAVTKAAEVLRLVGSEGVTRSLGENGTKGAAARSAG